MDNWIILSLVAPIFWAIANFVDKYVLEKHTIGVIDFVFFSSITSWIFVPILIAIFGMPVVDASIIIPLLTGAGLIYSYGFYGKGLEEGETSSLVLLFKLIPVVTVILAFLFLGQTLSSNEIIAFLIIFFGAVIVSFERKKGVLMKGFGMTMIAVVLWAIITLLADHGLASMDFWQFVIWDHVGAALAGLTLFLIPSMRKEVVQGLKEATAQKYAWFGLNNFFDFWGQVIIKKALAIAPSAGLVTVVMQSQSIYAIILGVALTLTMPKVFQEDVSMNSLVKKFAGTAVMLIGIYMLLA